MDNMPYLISKLEGQPAQKEAQSKPPFGPGLDPAVAGAIQILEIWGSSFSDPAGDYTEFKAFNKDGEQIASKRVAGF